MTYIEKSKLNKQDLYEIEINYNRERMRGFFKTTIINIIQIVWNVKEVLVNAVKAFSVRTLVIVWEG